MVHFDETSVKQCYQTGHFKRTKKLMENAKITLNHSNTVFENHQKCRILKKLVKIGHFWNF